MACDVWIVYLLLQFLIIVVQVIVFKKISNNIAVLIFIGAIMAVISAALFPFLVEGMLHCTIEVIP